MIIVPIILCAFTQYALGNGSWLLAVEVLKMSSNAMFFTSFQTDYFVKYIRPGRPFLLKGGAKYQRAFKVWNDEYLASFEGAATELVQVEPNKKEIREAQGFEISFKEFVQRYSKEKIYMVNPLPTFLQ